MRPAKHWAPSTLCPCRTGAGMWDETAILHCVASCRNVCCGCSPPSRAAYSRPHQDATRRLDTGQFTRETLDFQPTCSNSRFECLRPRPTILPYAPSPMREAAVPTIARCTVYPRLTQPSGLRSSGTFGSTCSEVLPTGQSSSTTFPTTSWLG